MVRKDLHEENRLSWNEATNAHNSHKKDQASFFRQGGSTLFPEELDLLSDISGLSLVHLQCNSGQDTLSLARLGARVTGVDISDSAITFARRLSLESGIEASYHQADVYDWLAETAHGPERFDLVFVSYGALVWLSDIQQWAHGIENILRPNGRLVILEFHPLLSIFDDDWSLKYPYFAYGKHLTWDEGVGDYVAAAGEKLSPSGYVEGINDFENPHRCHEFQWGIGEIVSAILEAGLQLSVLKEWPYMNGDKRFKDMLEMPGGRNYPPDKIPSLPLMFGLVARKMHINNELS